MEAGYRAALKALTATGRYNETADSFGWQSTVARDIARLVAENPDQSAARAAVHFLLVDTACYDLTQHADRMAIDADVAQIVNAVRAAI